MSVEETVNEWLGELGKSVDMDLKLDAEGVLVLELSNEALIVFDVPQGSPLVHIYAPVVSVPDNEEDALVLGYRALEMNLFLGETRGAALSFSKDSGDFILCYNVEIEGSNAEYFINIVSGFIDTLDEMKKQLTIDETDEEEEDEGSGKEPMMEV